MLALSTSCLSTEFDNGERLVEAISRLQVSAVELEYRITEAMFQQMRKPLKKTGVKVVSVHNYFPVPPIVPRSQASGDLFLLSHPDREERSRAIHWSTRTIEHAHELEAEVVVLHCGKIDMDPEMDLLFNYFDTGRIDSDEAHAFLEAKMAEREHKKPKHLDALLFSLDKLIQAAQKYDILLGLENRYSYYELPGPEELAVLFAEFDGSPLRYWHDIGHAQVNQAFTLTSHEDLLQPQADRLAGIHIHDVQGRDDHLVPGKGTVDFAFFKPYLKDDTLKVLELKHGTPEFEIAEALAFSKSLGIG